MELGASRVQGEAVMAEHKRWHLERWTGSSDVVHLVDSRYRVQKAKDYKDERPAGTERQRVFLRNLARMAIALRSVEVPVVVSADDGNDYYLDRGCTKVASTQGYIAELEDNGGGVSTLCLQASTGVPHRDLFRQRWHDVGLTGEECSSVDALIFGVSERAQAKAESIGQDCAVITLELALSMPSLGAMPPNSESSVEVGRTLSPEEAEDEPFDPETAHDAREKVLREIRARRGQKKFRDALIDAYEGRCAITGCDVLDILEAAHITPYLGPDTNHVTNGLLLRADLHTLFDAGLVAVDPKTKAILVAPTIKDPVYRALHGQPLRKTKTTASSPSEKALKQHRADCGW